MEGEAQVTAVLTGEVGKERTSESSEEKTEAPFFKSRNTWRMENTKDKIAVVGVGCQFPGGMDNI